MSDQMRVTLASISNGSALELFEYELKRVIANIADCNTSHKSKRKIVIEVEILPDEERNVGYASVSVRSKLASVKPTASVMYFGKKDGEYVAVETNPKQPGIFDSPEQRKQLSAVAPISGGKESV